MKNLNELENKKVAILGVGIEGIALLKFLSEYTQKITLLDKLTLSEIKENNKDNESLLELLKSEQVDTRFGCNYLDDLRGFDLIFRSPGISINDPRLIAAKKHGVEISSQIKLFFDLCPATIIGVTGTKGKGTTSSLIYEILSERYKSTDVNVYIAGNIGYPAITLLSGLKKKDFVILELSSFQLMDLNKSPHIAVLTNLTEDHLDYHASVEEYRESKLNILKYQSKDDYAVLNLTASEEFNLDKKTKAKILYFSDLKETDAFIDCDKENDCCVFLKKTNEPICRLSELHLLGVHNLMNIAAASLVAGVLGIDVDKIRQQVFKFTGLPHRLEKVRELNGVLFINDSFATNPPPAIAAIKSIQRPKIMILGGSSKGADFDELAVEIKKSNVKSVVLVGVEGKKIKSSLIKNNYDGLIIDGGRTMDEIVKKANGLASSGDAVILSPACASFGLFKNYKDRGIKFIDAVNNL